MDAVHAITEAAAELERTMPLPEAETTETLTKRLREIEVAHTAVVNAQREYDQRHDAAKTAKKYLDDCQETLISIVGRMTAVSSQLPLFTKDAEENAQASEESAPEGEWSLELATELHDHLANAGYIAATIEQIQDWTPEEIWTAQEWVKRGTLDELPEFMRELAETEHVEPFEPEPVVEPEPVDEPKRRHSRRRPA
jgi:hypothetical protein